MEELIKPILHKIFSELKEDTSSYSSLLGGKVGSALYSFAYLNFTSQTDSTDYLQAEVQRIAEIYADPGFDSSFCNGKSGTRWFFTYLNKKGILDDEDLDVLCQDNHELPDIALNMLGRNNYDFLHGAIGIAYCLLYSNKKLDQFYHHFFQRLKLLSAKSTFGAFIPDYDLSNQQPISDQTNLGLAHGLASILKFCIECYRQDTCKKEARLMAQDIIVYFLGHANKDTSRNYFPCFINVNGELNGYSRLGWCYGDLGIAYVLYQAGAIFSDNQLKTFSLDVLLHSTKRRTIEETSICDGGICHGSAGVAHMYNKIWHYTNETIFKDACDFWIQKTIDFSIHKPDSASYKKYISNENKYENSYSLLQGSAGIGLVLISYLTGDFSWDYCFMLNN
jgi:lantibiotic modifying enzyme